MKRFFSHLPAWVEESALANWRAAANIMAMACSAVVIELPNGVFMTTMPRAVAAGMSILSTPMPARPMTFSRVAAAITAALALVAERTARPSYSPIIPSNSSGFSPVFWWATMPRRAKISKAAGDNSSAIRTLGACGMECSIKTKDVETGTRQAGSKKVKR